MSVVSAVVTVSRALYVDIRIYGLAVDKGAYKTAITFGKVCPRVRKNSTHSW